MFYTPMLILTLAYLILFIVRVSYNLPPHMVKAIDTADFCIWFIFLLEFIILLTLSLDKVKFVKTHAIDLLIVIIPLFRVLRLVTVAELYLGAEIASASVTETFLRFLKGDSKIASLVLFIVRATSNAKTVLVKGKMRHIVLLIIFITIFLGALEVYFERDAPNANIVNIYDGIWWSIVSITTVGYGDRYPVTLPGRIVGVALLTIGVALFTLLTAEMSSLLVGKHEDQDKAEILSELKNVENQLDSLNKKISKG